MDELLEQYKDYKKEMDILSRKMEKVRQKIKTKLSEYPGKKFENETNVAYIKSMNRASISKKDVPNDFWERYSVMTQFETLYVKNKK